MLLRDAVERAGAVNEVTVKQIPLPPGEGSALLSLGITVLAKRRTRANATAGSG
jgi:hypothetical protein